MKINSIQPTYSYTSNSNMKYLKSNNPSFGIANSGKLKTLFTYGLPCMYSGTEMIDPKKVQRLLKIRAFDGPIKDVIRVMSPFEKNIGDIEGKVWQIIKEYSQDAPDLTLKETLQRISPIFEKRLRKKQNPIFHRLTEEAQDLPEGFKYRFKLFMHETDDKIKNNPVLVKFSPKEFKYKLHKIGDDIATNKNLKSGRVMKKLFEEASKLSMDKSSRANENHKQHILFMEKILKKSVLKDNEQLTKLLEDSKQSLNFEKREVPFSRKSFIYDLSKILEDLPDKKLKDNLLNIAEELPTSRNSTSAYIMKFQKEPSEKIAYRILWPFLASVEHIFPKSLGGADAMQNFGGACARENSERQNIDFTAQMKRRPQTRMNCQRYVNKLIELFKAGIFQKHNISPNYIEQFKKAIQKHSKGSIVLDTSKLK